MKFYIAICEDDIFQRKLLIDHLTNVFTYLDKSYNIKEFTSGEDLLNNYPEKLDILFLDIQMNEVNGIDVARSIRKFDSSVEIIFTTALLDYVHLGYEVRAYRYLLKPLNYDDILKHTSSCINDLMKRRDKVKIEDKSKIYMFNVDDIIYIEVIRKEIIVYTKEDNYTFKTSMKNIENNLITRNFFRCHKSYLINLAKVTLLKDNIVVLDNKEIPVSRYKLKQLKIELAKLLGNVLC